MRHTVGLYNNTLYMSEETTEPRFWSRRTSHLVPKYFVNDKNEHSGFTWHSVYSLSLLRDPLIWPDVYAYFNNGKFCETNIN